MVVDFPIEYDDGVVIAGGHGLIARGQVENLQAGGSEGAQAGGKYSLLVWPSMGQGRSCCANPIRIGSPAFLGKASNATQTGNTSWDAHAPAVASPPRMLPNYSYNDKFCPREREKQTMPGSHRSPDPLVQSNVKAGQAAENLGRPGIYPRYECSPIKGPLGPEVSFWDVSDAIKRVCDDKDGKTYLRG